LLPFEENRSTANAPDGAWFRGNHGQVAQQNTTPRAAWAPQ
jgi:hypothetical protein